MGSKKNWEKEEDSDNVESWVNQVTGEEVILEGSDGEHILWNSYGNEGLDANMPKISKEFSNRKKAHKKANQYMENNTGGDLDTRPVSKIIGEKLKEKTSSWPSKDAWGVRHDKKNQEIDNWNETPEMFTEVYDDEVVVTANVYHYLTEHLENTEYTAQMTRMLHQLISEEGGDLKWGEAIEQFTGGAQGENSYNRDNILSQDILYHMFDSVDNGRMEPTGGIYDYNYIVLQIHQGADARAGYTKPIVLKVNDIDYFIMGQTDLHALSENENGENLSWYSDDAGYNWYEGDGEGQENWVFKPEDDMVIYGPSGEEITFGSTAVSY